MSKCVELKFRQRLLPSAAPGDDGSGSQHRTHARARLARLARPSRGILAYQEQEREWDRAGMVVHGHAQVRTVLVDRILGMMRYRTSGSRQRGAWWRAGVGSDVD